MIKAIFKIWAIVGFFVIVLAGIMFAAIIAGSLMEVLFKVFA